MAALLCCPYTEKLQQLVAGETHPDEFQAFADHLEQCPCCAEQLEHLEAYRKLMEDVRQGVRVAPKYWAEETMGLDSPKLPPGTDAGGPHTQLLEATACEGGPAAPKPVEVAFLSPAQGPGEIGRFAAFRILEVLGTGGMGIVFLGEDPQLKRRVALKVMRPEVAALPAARQRFLREAQAVAAIEHDHIVPIYQVGEERGIPFLAMPLLKGQSLNDCLQRPGPLPLADVLRLGRQIALGLAAAHERGLVHRDIKPANLWLEPEQGGRIKVLDFGLARPIADDAHLTEQGVIVGTPSHMAPEQANGAQADQRCDLFSLGVVLYRMSTGQLPFRGENTLAVLSALSSVTPPRPQTLNPEVPAGLDLLVMQLLAKEPDDRPASAREVAERLQALEAERTASLDVGGSATERSPAGARPGRENIAAATGHWGDRVLWWLAAGIAGLVLLPLGYFYGGTLIRIATDKGELVIESDDPDIVVTVQGQTATVFDKVRQRRFVLSAGQYDVEVREEGDGGARLDTKHFTITRGGREVFHTRLQQPVDHAVLKAVQSVLAAGGKVTLRAGDKEREVTTTRDLPSGPFQVVGVNLDDDQQGTNALLDQLVPLTDLRSLTLARSNVAVEGLVHLEPFANLVELNLMGTTLSDEGLARLKTLLSLRKLNLQATEVRDAGLEHLLRLRNLVSLDLSGTKVSDAGLAHLQKLPRLQSVKLGRTAVTGPAALALRKELPRCAIGLDERQTVQWLLSIDSKLDIVDGGPERMIAKATDMPAGPFQVVAVYNEHHFTDEDLPQLQVFTNLKRLSLGRSKVSDAGLVHLQPLTNLQGLGLYGTGLTGEGFVHLKALPNLKNLDLYIVRLTAAGYAQLSTLTNLEELNLGQTNCAAYLAFLKPLTKLRLLSLLNSDVNDASLEHLGPLTNLTSLDLRNTHVTDAGLRHLKALTNLEVLHIGGNYQSGTGRNAAFRDDGLVHLKSLANLKSLTLAGASVSDAGLIHLQGLTSLIHLSLQDDSLITDAGIMHLEKLPKLKSLYIFQTKVTAAGAETLRKARPDIQIRGQPGK
jgi:Leucine-rich repeat (LRR) protein/tRNA A-37 threonylcarbamoyl transferase component Bud32